MTATFAASLITSPAIGAHLARLYSENFVIALGRTRHSLILVFSQLSKSIRFLGTAVAILDLLFIFFAVPESLPERLRTEQKVSWEKIDPFAVRFVFLLMKSSFLFGFVFSHCETSHMIVLSAWFVWLYYYLIYRVRCFAQFVHRSTYSCWSTFRGRPIFVFLCLFTTGKKNRSLKREELMFALFFSFSKLLGFSEDEIAYFIAFVGIFSCVAQVQRFDRCFLSSQRLNRVSRCSCSFSDSALSMFTTLFRLKRNNYGRTVLSDRSISCLWNRNFELVKKTRKIFDRVCRLIFLSG